MTIVITLAFCFAAQALALRASGGRTTKSESNFFSSIARVQAGARGQPEIMLLGSSITGRLPDRAQGFHRVANMGCDGGHAFDILRAINEGHLPGSPVLVIEANTLARALDPTPTDISLTLDRFWFKMGIRFPLLSAYARPSAFLYSAILNRKIGADQIQHDQDLGVDSRPSIPDLSHLPTLDSRYEVLVHDAVAELKRAVKDNRRVVIVWLPPARASDAPPSDFLMALASRADIEWWDLGNEADPSIIQLTDTIHMSAPSAARTTASLVKALLQTPDRHD